MKTHIRNETSKASVARRGWCGLEVQFVESRRPELHMTSTNRPRGLPRAPWEAYDSPVLGGLSVEAAHMYLIKRMVAVLALLGAVALLPSVARAQVISISRTSASGGRPRVTTPVGNCDAPSPSLRSEGLTRRPPSFCARCTLSGRCAPDL